MRIDGIQLGKSLEGLESISRIPANKNVPSFKDTLAAFVNDVNDAQVVASDAQKQFLAGEITDVHQVILKSEEANVGFNMLMELKNKSFEGLNELMRTRL